MSEQYTKGPWAWYGNTRVNEIYLATVDRGRQFVMTFGKKGPEFQENKMMVPAKELCRFEVGDETVRGHRQAKGDGGVYRYDISAIDHPDARLIAAAPDLLEALEELCDIQGCVDVLTRYEESHGAIMKKARLAIKKATGREMTK